MELNKNILLLLIKEEIAKAMEEDDPDIDMSKKMAIATSQAKISA